MLDDMGKGPDQVLIGEIYNLQEQLWRMQASKAG